MVALQTHNDRMNKDIVASNTENMWQDSGAQVQTDNTDSQDQLRNPVVGVATIFSVSNPRTTAYGQTVV